MANWRQLTDSLVELCLHRTLRGFEQALGKIWLQLSIDAWGVFLPPSFQAGDRQLFMGQGVRPTGPLLTQAAQQGIESLAPGGRLTPQVVETLAGELIPGANWIRRILQIGDSQSPPLILFVFRRPERGPFNQADLELLAWTGTHVRKAFAVLAEQQEQEFMVGLFRLVSNLHPEGICVLDKQQRPLFESRNFREHLMLWEHGSKAQALSLPRATALPDVWQKACFDAFRTLADLKLPPTGGRLVVSQGPVVNLAKKISEEQRVLGAVRYLAMRSTLGLRPYLLLTSSIAITQQSQAGPSLARLAERFDFSRREVQMADLILRGHSADEIGTRLKIALPTVKTHIRNILRKAGAKTRLQFIGLVRSG